jgi:predicted RecA/RadA family phage recombinase
MKNFTSNGKNLGLKTNNTYSSSDIVLENNIAGVASIDTIDGITTTKLDGVFKAVKDASVFDLGEAVYWDGVQATSNPVGNFQLGFAVIDGQNSVDFLLSTGLTSITGASLVTALALAPAFRGYVDDVNEVDTPQENDLAYDNTTESIWIYSDGAWYNTFKGISRLLEFINRAQDNYLSLNHEIFFDGIDAYIDFDNTTADILDFSKSWSIGINVKSFEPISNQYRTLFSNGTNEISIRYNGTATRYRVYASTNNGWREAIDGWLDVENNSRILITYTSNNMKLYINGDLEADETHVEFTNNNNPGGDLKVGLATYPGHQYFEGNLSELYLTKKEMNDLEADEFFTTRQVITHSYYNDVSSLDYFVFGEDAFNQVDGKKGNVTGLFFNGLPSDFIEV